MHAKLFLHMYLRTGKSFVLKEHTTILGDTQSIHGSGQVHIISLSKIYTAAILSQSYHIFTRFAYFSATRIETSLQNTKIKINFLIKIFTNIICF
jgi:hypothetical protein